MWMSWIEAVVAMNGDSKSVLVVVSKGRCFFFFPPSSVRPLRMKSQCISIELRAMGGCRNGAKGAGVGSLKSADFRPTNWRPAAAPQPWGRQLGGRQPACRGC